ncbi:GDP-L-fucose synthase family protein [Clostridium estertheticum]|uniref:GDP-L-fucose synthase n=1 Tax=Clostridium estertheticum TaxID=238834 RepID=A0AA47ELY8_9CLOT|nr:GDP-L-fucose synthase [Clostridium estertheticum]MBU3157942.1 GDP-L-fucose synthase [Clostridium estertheticum]WAG62520.1 GDP-L-fucose synthase [Clostridium estertheticum]
MKTDSKIYVAGHRGLVGSAIVRNLKEKGYTNIIGRSHSELDLMNQQDVRSFLKKEKPEYVFQAAAKVGGIGANSSYPADFIYENMEMQNNLIKAAHDFKVTKLLFLGSSCIYPKNCPQPIKEEYLLSGYLEPTNEGYAIAKIAGLKMCQFYKKQYGDNFISCMPTNLYGSNDNYDLNNSHVMPALIRKFHEAKVNNESVVEIWGTGKPLREFLYVDDMADACVYLMENYDGEEHVNVGTGKELTIGELAEMVKRVVGFTGELMFNGEKPDGTKRKLLDVSKLEGTGWKYKVEIEDGVRMEYEWFRENYK